MSPLLQLPEACASCDTVRPVYVRSGGVGYCSRCLGSRKPDDLGAAHDLEVQTRERMTARGSTDRHLVRSGKS